MPAEPPTGVSSTTTVPPTWTSPRLPRMCGGSPPQPALHGSLHVQACDFASVPFRPQVTPGALNIGYRTSTAKAREGLTPPRQRNCQAYTHLQVPQAEPGGSRPGSDHRALRRSARSPSVLPTDAEYGHAECRPTVQTYRADPPCRHCVQIYRADVGRPFRQRRSGSSRRRAPIETGAGRRRERAAQIPPRERTGLGVADRSPVLAGVGH
jgi:hypothetical protein